MLGVVMVLGFISAATAIPCEEANLRCSFRTGCGNALKGYMIACSTILHETPPDQCPEGCQNALIALTSTDEGKDLMTCECANNMCRETKQKLEVCKPHVMKAIQNDTIVTCEVAQWICAADATCSKALEYYHKYCQAMFFGRKCTYRCKNSISILKKQEKAAKLDSCLCNGKEEYDCPRIRQNMAKLCFNKTIEVPITIDVESNDVKPNINQEKTNDIFSNDIDNGSSSTFSSITNTLIPIMILLCKHFVT
ncbi:growth arrest-specific protein 1-like [Planococcus citri]|uniref:growth arrest-specific protein 1-like n=1 Tax=Planococcus citri TaxID=170843 RepID=UPI0031F780EA